MGNCSFKHDDEVTPTIGGYPSKLKLTHRNAYTQHCSEREQV
jgi:hypothetical protein